MELNKVIKISAVILLVILASSFILAQNSGIKQIFTGKTIQNDYGTTNNNNPIVNGNNAAASCGTSGGGCGCGGAMMNNNKNTAPGNAANIAAAQTTPTNNGVMELTVSYQNGGYYPNIIKLKKGTPVKMTMNLNTIQGCLRNVRIADLGVSKNLREGDNIIEFTPDKTGTFTMQCTMGMGKATIVVEE